MAFNGKNNFFETAQFRSIGTDDTRLPARLFFDVFHIHAEQISRKQGCFVTAGSATDFHDDVFIVPRVFRQHEDMQLFFQSGLLLFQIRYFLFGHGDDFGITFRIFQ